jgi:hypothetical protein
MRILALLVLGLVCVPAAGYAQSGPFSTPWDGRGFVEVGGGGQGGSHLLTDTSRFPIYDEEATIAVSQTYGGGPLFHVGGGAKVWQNLLVGLTYTRFSQSMETAVLARVPNPLVLNRFREAQLRQNDLKHAERSVHLSAIYMVPLREDLTLGLSLGPSFTSVSHEFARDVRVGEAGGAPFDAVNISDVAFVRSSKTKATFNLGANLAYDLPFRLGDHARLGTSLGFRYSKGTVALDGASGPVDVKFGGPQITGGIRVGF